MSEWFPDLMGEWRAGPGPAGTIFTYQWGCACGSRGSGATTASQRAAEIIADSELRHHRRSCPAEHPVTRRPATRLRPTGRPDLAAKRQAWMEQGTDQARREFLAALDAADETQLAALDPAGQPPALPAPREPNWLMLGVAVAFAAMSGYTIGLVWHLVYLAIAAGLAWRACRPTARKPGSVENAGRREEG